MGDLVHNGSKYTDVKRREAIGAFLILGNMVKVAALLDMPARTLRNWSETEWWSSELTRVRLEKSQELDIQLSNSIEKARESVDARLDVGDAYIKKDGEIGYKPVSCRDSATVLGILYDKRALMRNMPTKIVNNQNLNELQKTFEDLVTKRVEFNDSIVSEG